MSWTSCVVKTCHNIHIRSTRISYHLVPKCAKRRRNWEKALGYALTPTARVCSSHFLSSDYLPIGKRVQARRMLKPSAVPSVNLPEIGPYVPADIKDAIEDAKLAAALYKLSAPSGPHEDHCYALWPESRDEVRKKHATASTQVNFCLHACRNVAVQTNVPVLQDKCCATTGAGKSRKIRMCGRNRRIKGTRNRGRAA